MYLNKAGYNGLYRVNKSGVFNTPFGHKENFNIIQENNISNIREYFSKNSIISSSIDYKEILKKTKKGDFVFVDPPYDGDTFNSYSKLGFGTEDQIELAKTLVELDKREVKWLLTNHNTDLIKKLYKKFNSFEMVAKRLISSDSSKRHNKVNEVFITNYKIPLSDAEIKTENLLRGLLDTNNKLSDFTNWQKIKDNLSKIELYLNDLNFLTNISTQKELTEKIEVLFKNKGSEPFKILEILVAKRQKNDEERKYFNSNTFEVLKYDFNTLSEIKKFIKETNLIEVFKEVKSLKDFVFGVEVGLDSHGRKSRTGQTMENLVKELLGEANIIFEEQIDLTKLLKDLNQKTKKLDFVFKIKNKIYAIETSFYNSQGSKISETLKSYVTLAQDLKKQNINLIWVVDGAGVKSIKRHIIDNINRLEINNLNQFKEQLNKWL